MEQQLYELPDGWEWKPLGDITQVQSGTGFPKEYQGKADDQYPFLKVGDMNLPGNESRILSWNNSISTATASSIKAKIMPAGTVIFPKIGGAIATNKKRILTTPSAFDNNVMGLAAKGNLTSAFLYWYLVGFDLAEWASSSSLPSMKASTIKAHHFPLPSVTEQKRIVAKLDALFTRIDAAITHLQQTLELSKALFASVLDKAFHPLGGEGEEYELPDGWMWKGLTEIVSTSGFKVGKISKRDFQTEGPLPIVDQSQQYVAGYCQSADGYSGKLPVIVYGDHTNSVKHIDFQFICGADGTKVLVPEAGVDSWYLYYAILRFRPDSQGYRRHFPILKQKLFPIPSIGEQEHIVVKLDALAESTRALEAETQDRLNQLSALKSSLLDAAFRGQL